MVEKRKLNLKKKGKRLEKTKKNLVEVWAEMALEKEEKGTWKVKYEEVLEEVRMHANIREIKYTMWGYVIEGDLKL